MGRDYFHEAQHRGADGDHLYRDQYVATSRRDWELNTETGGMEEVTRPATPAPDGAPTATEIAAAAARIAFRPLASALGPLPDPIASLCLKQAPWVGIVCCKLAGHTGTHQSNPIPSMRWEQ